MHGLFVSHNDPAPFQTIPAYLQDHLFGQENLQGRFHAFGPQEFNILHADENMIRSYLGTYFPRSFAESRAIHSSLLGFPCVREQWESRDTLHILDLGSGAGGNLAGLLHALADFGLTNSVHIVSIEGNRHAAETLRSVLDRVGQELGISVSLDVIASKLPYSPGPFGKTLAEIMDSFPFSFDLVMAWKSICELFQQSKSFGCGLYRTLARVSIPRLSEHGLISVLGLTKKINNRWLPLAMSTEIAEFARENTEECGIVMPFSCALWGTTCPTPRCYTRFETKVSHRLKSLDNSRYTYRALAKRTMADEIIASLSRDEEYRVDDIKFLSCSQGQVMERLPQICEPWDEPVSSPRQGA